MSEPMSREQKRSDIQNAIASELRHAAQFDSDAHNGIIAGRIYRMLLAEGWLNLAPTTSPGELEQPTEERRPRGQKHSCMLMMGQDWCEGCNPPWPQQEASEGEEKCPASLNDEHDWQNGECDNCGAPYRRVEPSPSEGERVTARGQRIEGWIEEWVDEDPDYPRTFIFHCSSDHKPNVGVEPATLVLHDDGAKEGDDG